MKKEIVLTALSTIFGVGSVVVNVISEKNRIDETAKKAAKIVMSNKK